MKLLSVIPLLACTGCATIERNKAKQDGYFVTLILTIVVLSIQVER